MKAVQITVEPYKGATIHNACSEVKELSEKIGQEIEFKFNGVRINTHNRSILEMVEMYCKQAG